MEKITADLKGADFSRKLVWKTREGFDVMPFYRQEDVEKLNFKNSLPGDFPFVRGDRVNHNTWLVRQDISVTDFKEANNKALDILMKGVTSLGFIIEDPEEINVENIRSLLKDIHCESVELNFATAGKARELLAALISVMWASEINLSQVNGSIAADPLGRLVANGKLCVTINEGLDYLAALVKEAVAIPGLRCVIPSGTLFSNAGAGIVAELAYTLSLGNEYMASLTSRGISPEIAASKIRFSFGTGPDFFPECAKLRAARMLWALIVKGYGIKHDDSALMSLHSVTGRWNKTLFDPHVNLLRTQTEAMSAVIGGSDSITVEAFDIIYKTPDEFSERLARNQQLLLMEESHLDKVADPAAGSYYIEKLTAIIAQQAWTLFLETESEGGFLEAVKKGLIQKKISETAAIRKDDVAKRREIILGTNQYPNFTEQHTSIADLRRAFEDKANKEGDIDQVTPTRGSLDFEKLRMATEKSDHRPVVFILPIGDVNMRRARAQFSSNFFACAGYEVIDNNGFESAGEGVNAAIDAKADIIVICSSDDDYAIVAHDIFTLTAGRSIVVIAGNPPGIDNLKAAGIEHFISIRSNVLETLKMFSKKMGITDLV